ncbi:fibronectin type III domain-containing protein [Tenacibaculum sp. TC6]|uniref:fibronectin type III domain-containing protein n=1 Tax=Tenacibaculum sp. TC6 TaxID=3423223 RepID=UPI003D361140
MSVLYKKYLTLCIILCMVACSKEEVIENKNPEPFEVKVVTITAQSASIQWNKAVTTDKISYTIYLNETSVVANLSETTYNITNLQPETTYNGKVVATNQNGGTTTATFSFLTPAINQEEGSLLWEKSLGGSLSDISYSVLLTNDEGCLVAGSTKSTDGDITLNRGGQDCWLVKLNKEGTIQWQKSYGGTKQDVIHSICQANNGGYIVGAFSSSFDNQVEANNGMRDYWIVKLNEAGDIQWKTTVGGNKDDIVEGITATSDGGCVVAGFSSSDEIGVNGQSDAWVVKLDTDGNVEWHTHFGEAKRDLAYAITETDDGGYMAVGATETANGTRDILVVKLNEDGNVLWSKTFGGSKNEWGNSIQKTASGEYLIGGSSDSSDGEVTDNNGSSDAWFIKLNASGNIIWTKTFGGTDSDFINEVCPTSDNGCIAVGGSRSSNADFSENHGGTDFWVVKLNAAGTIEWHKQYGGTGNDYAYSVQQDAYGNYWVSGSWYTHITGEGESETGDDDFWVLKLKGK